MRNNEINDVRIRIADVSSDYCGDGKVYACQFKKPYSILWRPFLALYSGHIGREITSNPEYFNHYKSYDYKKCKLHNKNVRLERKKYLKAHKTPKYIYLK